MILAALLMFSSCKKEEIIITKTVTEEVYVVDTMYLTNDFGGDYRGEYLIINENPSSSPFAKVSYKDPATGDTIETILYGKGMSFQFPIFSGDEVWLKTWLLDSTDTYQASVFADTRINSAIVRKATPISQFSYILK